MKKSAIIAVVTFLVCTQSAFADLGERVEKRLDVRGDRIENRLEIRGNRINNPLDRAAVRAAAAGHLKAASRLDRRGNQIERRLNLKGNRIDLRLDRRGKRLNRVF